MPAGTCLRAHVVSQCTRLPRISIRSGRLLDAPGALGQILDALFAPGAIGRLLDRPGVAGRNSDTSDVLGRNIAITQRRGGRFSPENTASVRMSPENENESPEHGSHRSSPETRMKHQNLVSTNQMRETQLRRAMCQMGIQRMDYPVRGHIGDRPRPSRKLPPDHIGNRSESNRARPAPNWGPSPHLTKGPPPKRRALCERFATAYTARKV